MKNLHAWLVAAARTLGGAGVAGLGLLAFAAGFYVSALRPEQARLEHLRGEVLRLDDPRARIAGDAPASSRDQLKQFYGYFPPSSRTADLLARIYRVAEQQSITLEQGDYRFVRDSVTGLTHYQVILPLRASYPQVRKFVAASLIQVPNLSLDSIQFERQKIGDSTVEAKVKFVMILGREP